MSVDHPSIGEESCERSMVILLSERRLGPIEQDQCFLEVTSVKFDEPALHLETANPIGRHRLGGAVEFADRVVKIAAHHETCRLADADLCSEIGPAQTDRLAASDCESGTGGDDVAKLALSATEEPSSEHADLRSEERRVGKEGRSRGAPYH